MKLVFCYNFRLKTSIKIILHLSKPWIIKESSKNLTQYGKFQKFELHHFSNFCKRISDLFFLFFFKSMILKYTGFSWMMVVESMSTVEGVKVDASFRDSDWRSDFSEFCWRAEESAIKMCNKNN